MTRIVLKADLHGTTFAYNCRMQLAHVMLTTRIASCKSALQLAYDCCTQHEKSCRILIHVLKLHDNCSKLKCIKDWV